MPRRQRVAILNDRAFQLRHEGELFFVGKVERHNLVDMGWPEIIGRVELGPVATLFGNLGDRGASGSSRSTGAMQKS